MQEEFEEAYHRGNAGRVRELIKDDRVDPCVYENGPILYAAYNGFTEVVRVLLDDPRVNPTTTGNQALRSASREGHVEVMRMLLSDPRVDAYDAIACAWGEGACMLAEDDRFGIEQYRDLYMKRHSFLVHLYDSALARGLTMAWVAKQLPPWESLVEPVAKRLQAGFICE
jgi:hypothetical protein